MPERLFVSGDSQKDASPLTMLLNLMLAEKGGISPTADMHELRAECEKLATEATQSLKSLPESAKMRWKIEEQVMTTATKWSDEDTRKGSSCVGGISAIA